MSPLSACIPGMPSHRCRPSLLFSIFPLAYSPSITKKCMRELSGAPCSYCVILSTIQGWAEPQQRWQLLLFPILPIGTQVYMHLHTSTAPHAHVHECTPCFHPQQPPAPTERVQDGSGWRTALLHPALAYPSSISDPKEACVHTLETVEKDVFGWCTGTLMFKVYWQRITESLLVLL